MKRPLFYELLYPSVLYDCHLVYCLSLLGALFIDFLWKEMLFRYSSNGTQYYLVSLAAYLLTGKQTRQVNNLFQPKTTFRNCLQPDPSTSWIVWDGEWLFSGNRVFSTKEVQRSSFFYPEESAMRCAASVTATILECQALSMKQL